MEFILCYTTSHQIVAGNRIIADCRTDVSFIGKNQLVLLEALDQLDISWNNHSQRVERGTIIFGKGFQIINTHMEKGSFRGIVFFTENTDFLKSPIFITHDSQQSFESINEIMNHPLHTNDDLAIVESQFNQFFKAYFLKIEDSTTIKNDRLTGRIDPRLLTVNRYIRNHYGKPLTLQILADLIVCNPVYLSNMYSKIFKISPMKYLQNVRMQQAKELIISTNLCILEITQKLGYISNSQFGALFRRYHGITPYEFRIKHRLATLNIGEGH